MKYKVETLKIGNDKSIDILEGCIPIKELSLVILRPIENDQYIEEKELEEKKIEEEIEKKCFFCEKNLTRDKMTHMSDLSRRIVWAGKRVS